MSKKPRKVDEAKAAYAAKKPAKAAAVAPTKARQTEFQRIAGKLFAERKDLLHKLAQ